MTWSPSLRCGLPGIRKRASGHMKRTKAEWRRALLTARAGIPESVRRAGSAAMVEHVRRLSCFEGARSILGYAVLGAEADPVALLASGAASGRAVFLPSSSSGLEDQPRWVAWNDQCQHEGAAALAASCLAYPVLAIVPGLGFDARGMRLGRGRGFYDRALADLRRAGAVHAVGLAFECQIVADLPSDVWDQCVDFVVSESRVVVTNLGAGSGREAGARWS